MSSLIEEAAAVARKRRSGPRKRAAVGPATIADTALNRRIVDVVREVEEILGHPSAHPGTCQRSDCPDTRLQAALSLARDGLRRETPRLAGVWSRKLVTCTLELQELSQEVCDRRLEQRFEALGNVRRALRRLEGVDSTATLMQRGTLELCRVCGFDRALMFRMEGPELVAETAEFRDDPAWARAVLEFAKRARPRLDEGSAEGEATRRRRSLLVSDAQELPRRCPLIVATDTYAYVAAPIMPGGEIVGFLHADRYFSEGVVDELDRDTLSAFTEGLGYAVAWTTLLDRVRSEHQSLRIALASADAAMSRICESKIALSRTSNAPQQHGPAPVASSPLTRRQHQILELMADGATNADIANRLVLSQDTVKFHVRGILKRMRAANRAEAVSRYLRNAGREVGKPASRWHLRR